MIGGLLFAGYDTTRNQLGHALFRFALAPDQWSILAERPELAGQAVDEVMRLHGAVVGVPRIAAAEVEVDGWVIPPRTLVFLSLASANRDDTVFDDPLRFDITARRPPHLSFGGGPHYCLGANLARAEMEEALRILSRRLCNLRVGGEVSWRAGTAITGPSSLPLTFELLARRHGLCVTFRSMRRTVTKLTSMVSTWRSPLGVGVASIPSPSPSTWPIEPRGWTAPVWRSTR